MSETTRDNSKFQVLSASYADGSSFGKKMLKSLPVILIASIIGFCLHKSGWLGIFENATLDFVAQTRQLSLRQVAQSIHIVEIDANDYDTLFKSKSPLDAGQLTQLLKAVAYGQPRLIVVDIGTDAREHRNIELPDFKGKIVWARSWKQLSNDEATPLLGLVTPEAIPLLPICKRVILQPSAILGGDVRNGSALSGLAYLPSDADAGIRRYCRRLQVLPDKDSGAVTMADALPWIASKAFDPEVAQKESTEANDVVISFLKDQSKLPMIKASEVLKTYLAEGWTDTVKDKIVILGGTFDGVRDVYKTRAGPTTGVGLIAQIIATELNFGGTGTVGDGWLLVSQIVLSLLFVAINVAFPRSWVPIVGLIAIPFAAFGFSTIALRNFAMWANFVPALFVVQVYAFYEHLQDVRRKNIELKTANEALLQARKALARGVDELSQIERKRVSETLHDETMMDLFQIETALTPLQKIESAEEIYENVYNRLQQTRKNVRGIMENLFPSVLKNNGLTDAISTLCSNLTTTDSVLVFVDTTDGAVNALPEYVQFRIFRIAQNALRNILQHAEATEVEVKLNFAGTDLVMSISDNGKGFDGASQRADGQGVPNMKTNADILDGTITWITPSTRFGRGTEVRLVMPFGIDKRKMIPRDHGE